MDQTQTSAPDFSIILVCWNNIDYLDPCLKSLSESNLESAYEIVVVDNGSNDGSQAMLRAKFPQVKLIQNKTNVGLSRASNQGIEVTSARYVLLLNNDTLVNKTAIDGMVDFLDETEDAGAVGGKLINPDGSFQAGYADFPSLLQELLIATRIGELLWEGYPSHKDSQENKSIDWMSSACLMIRRSALEETGLLDEEFFIYGDEKDLQYRLKQVGWNVYYLPWISTVHFGGRSMNRWGRRKMVYRGKMLFFKKNYGKMKTLLLRSLFGGLSLIKMLSWSVAYLAAPYRERARNELQSNLDVLRLCWHLE